MRKVINISVMLLEEIEKSRKEITQGGGKKLKSFKSLR